MSSFALQTAMSAISRLFPASRRLYSSYFSSKPGGGRYFNSAKSPRSPIIAEGARNVAKGSSAAPAESRDGGVNAKDHAHSGETTSQPVDTQSTNSTHPGSPSTPSAKAESGNSSTLQADSRAPNTPHSSIHNDVAASRALPLHPLVKPQDFKVVQFFSMHRPLLSLSDPRSMFSPSAPQQSPSEEPLFKSDLSGLPAPPSNILSSLSSSPIYLFDDHMETSPEGDAETARQLSRALAVNKAAPTVAWEKTLRMLGLDVEMEPERVVMREQMERDWEVMMDSTKRKRRKKMKKHK